MRVTYEQFYGCIDKMDLQLVKPRLHLEDSREVEALEVGWLYSEGVWYNSRSVRLRVDDQSTLKRISGYYVVHTKDLTKQQWQSVQIVYDEFIRIKGFNDLYQLTPDDPRTSWLLVVSDRVHAFTMMTSYDGAIESCLTAWDYSKPKESLSKKLTSYEIDLARSQGYKHLYIGPGYGSTCTYKTKFPGFEWWTGNEWSTDVDKYTMLCERDDSVQTLEQLGQLYAKSNIL